MTARQKLEAELVEVQKFSIKAEIKMFFDEEKKNNTLPNMVNYDFYLLAERRFAAKHGGLAYSNYDAFLKCAMKA